MTSVATRCLTLFFVVSFGASSFAADSPARAKLRIVTLGDSITRGVRSGVTAEQTFASLLQAELRKTGAEVEVINVGIGGEKTNGALARLDKDVIAKQPDIVTIMYGTNDSYVYPNKTASDLTRDEYVTNLRLLIDRLRAAKIKPVLMTEPRWGDKATLNGVGENPNVRLEPFMVACREVAKEKQVTLIDHFAQWTARNASPFDIGQWTTDQCHLNPAGHKVVTATILKTLRREKLAELVQPLEVRTIRADGKHNAFTAFRRFKGKLWLAFRAAKDHNSQDGDIVVLKSADNGQSWQEAFKLDVVPDDRDPQFLVTEKRLFLYDAGMKGPELTTFLTYTDDGEAWSKPQPVYEPRFIVWKPIEHNGKFYSGAHKKDEVSSGKGREVHLIESEDGIAWRKISTIRAGNWESETTLYFSPDHKATAFLRQKYGSPPAAILETSPPYAEWRERKPDVNHFSGHSVHTFRGVTYLLTRTMDSSKKQTGSAIFTFADGELTPYCQLPSGGDCAYLEAVEDGENMLVSFYSTHEGSTNIYLAKVPLQLVP